MPLSCKLTAPRRADQIRARRAGEQEGKWTLCLYTLYMGSFISPYLPTASTALLANR